MDLDDPDVKRRLLLEIMDVQHKRAQTLFEVLEAHHKCGRLPSPKVQFDSCIIDPPKKKVMLFVYSSFFLQRLAQRMREGALVAAYVPPAGISARFAQSREHIIDTFEATQCFQFVDHWDPEHRHIFRFIRTKKKDSN